MIKLIRTRLFLGFLLCISIPAALGPVVYVYLQEHAALAEVSGTLSDTERELLLTEQYGRDFINFSQRDQDFFASGNSEYLAKREAAMARAYDSLDALRGKASPTFEALLDDLLKSFDAYSWTFSQLAQRVRERGFQDHGVVGRMRDIIHSLEAQVADDDLMVHMLTLRRHEKDYIIRNQTRYVTALVERATVFEQAIANHPRLSIATKQSMIERLDLYVASFRDLVAIDETIGIRSRTGLFEDLFGIEQRLTSSFGALEMAVAAYASNRAEVMTRYLSLAAMGAAAFALLASMALSRRLTRPLNELSSRMRDYVESEFKQHVDLEDLTRLNDEVGHLARDFGAVQQAITDHVSSIRKMAYYDNLTGAASRAYLTQRLNEMIGSAQRRSEGLSLFFVDLDKFKDVNDTLGHDAGDQLLIEVVNRLTDSVRACDFVARLGGDEFCVLLEGLSDEADIAVVAERCIGNLQQPITLSGKTFKPAGSIGIARFPADGTDADELMQAGDNAMYAAKVAGHHRFEFFRKEMGQRAVDRLTIAQELRSALNNEEFRLHYQPQVDVRTGEVRGWEALVRWQHPKRGLVAPDEFLPEIERLGLINELGTWVVREACQQLAAWRDEGLDDLRMSVNVAPRQLADKQLFCVVSQAITDSGIKAEQLELEVTESGIQATEDGAAILNRLKSLGIRVAIDDFGTGYSSLGSLKYLPVDRLKIDRSFVRDMASNAQDAVLLGTIMSLGHALKFNIVAEGVEDLEQLQILQGLDCDLVQGYFFSKPLAPEAVPAIARKGYIEPDDATANERKAG
ncbi:MAG: EAL domain-containing protein [Pseudomonadota bacterium]